MSMYSKRKKPIFFLGLFSSACIMILQKYLTSFKMYISFNRRIFQLCIFTICNSAWPGKVSHEVGRVQQGNVRGNTMRIGERWSKQEDAEDLKGKEKILISREKRRYK